MWRVGVLALVACGRLDFDPGAPRSDATPDVAIDAQPNGYCDPFTTVTSEECAAARLDPSSATDAQIFACSESCAWGACQILDKDDCPTCACQNYVKSSLICDAGGLCGAPINGTGCLGGNYHAGAPLSCPSGSGDVAEGACLLRALTAMGDC